jgi:hypothetical protein
MNFLINDGPIPEFLDSDSKIWISILNSVFDTDSNDWLYDPALAILKITAVIIKITNADDRTGVMNKKMSSYLETKL